MGGLAWVVFSEFVRRARRCVSLVGHPAASATFRPIDLLWVQGVYCLVVDQLKSDGFCHLLFYDIAQII